MPPHYRTAAENFAFLEEHFLFNRFYILFAHSTDN